MISDCTAIILAGGDSQRMGCDKAELLLDGQSLLQRVTAKMQQVFPEVIVSVRQPRPGLNLPQVCDAQAGDGLQGGGPLAGLAAGLGRVTTPWAFLVACDMPFIEPAMIALLAGYRSGYQAVVPVVQGHQQTLAAFYAADCLDALRAHLARGGKNSLRALLEQLEVQYVDESALLPADSALRSFRDIDTPEDIETARDQLNR
ncbi:MAG: molybdenum cofactor guanylyltransferase [Gallionella sp.]|nr:molybdenum cofactor guanylyltransferase [Gallionella sp.]